MSVIDRIGALISQKKGVNKGIGRDKNGVEIWNRDGDNLRSVLFQESSSSENKEKVWNYSFYPAGTKFEEDPVKNGFSKFQSVEKKGGIFNEDEFFAPGVTVLELGCGGGQAAVDLAKKYRGRGVNYLATDHEIGKGVIEPVHFLPNLKFQNVDWKQMPFEDGSVDRILSRQGIALYGGEDSAREMTRVAKVGAIFRGDEGRAVMGRRNFSDHLCEMGWNVWKLKGGLIVAQKVGNEVEQKDSENIFDKRVIKLDYPDGKYAVINEKTKQEMWNAQYSDTVSSQIMETERLDTLLTDLRTRFAGKNIGMRGIMTSLDGDLSVKFGNETITVFDINKLLQDGVEQIGAKSINIAPVGLADSVDEIPDRVEQYFLKSIKHMLVNEGENVSLRDKLFPAIVIYDLSEDSPLGKLKKVTGYYNYTLPEESEDRAKIVLGIYPIDVRFSLPANK